MTEENNLQQTFSNFVEMFNDKIATKITKIPLDKFNDSAEQFTTNITKVFYDLFNNKKNLQPTFQKFL